MREIPDAALERGGIAIIGQPDSGKTHAAKTMVERAVDNGWRTIVLDPLSAWLGMQVAANGQDPRLPMLLFGGDHANICITHSLGRLVPRFLALSELSAVVDLRQLVGPQFFSFALDFLRELYEIQLKSAAPLWLVLDEADLFAPQVPRTTEEKKLLRVVEDIVARGRTSGFRTILVTQRLAKINKNVVSMARTMIVMKMTGSQDRRSASEWLDGIAGNGQEIRETLAQLQQGEAWVATPSHPAVFRMKFRPLTTYDTSATPAAPVAQVTSPFAAGELGELVRTFQEIAEQGGFSLLPQENADILPEITRLRVKCNLSRSEFATQTEQTPSNIARYENGEVSPTIAQLKQLAARVGHGVKVDFYPLITPETVVPFRRA